MKLEFYGSNNHHVMLDDQPLGHIEKGRFIMGGDIWYPEFTAKQLREIADKIDLLDNPAN